MSLVSGQQGTETGLADQRRGFVGGAQVSRSDRIRDALVATPIGRPLRRFWSGLGTCLMYHRIAPDDSAPNRSFSPNRELMVRESEFERQIAYIARYYNCLSLPEAVELLERGKLPRRSVIVTFDDGYLDNLTLALPILQAYRVPATVYVATGIIERAVNMWWYDLEDIIGNESSLAIQWNGKHWTERIETHRDKRECFARLNRKLKRMSPEEQDLFLGRLRPKPAARLNLAGQVLDHDGVRQLSDDPLITIGAHTHRHLVLSSLPAAQLREEIATSRRLLETWTGRQVRHLAYPFGDRHQAGAREFQTAKAMGFESATTTRLGHLHAFHARQPFALPRIAVGFDDNMARFRWKLSGYDCMVRRPLSRVMT
jgi:peptidoglycan/xylan/chitin deacetylase (PgdA/CDA1 family)